ncbi:MAG: D-aminoacyl-tRNA deacylase, partial [Terriglobia bacterium]
RRKAASTRLKLEISRREHMRAVVQRVTRAEVRIAGEVAGRIAAGLLALVGIGANDTTSSARELARKILNLRVLGDAEGKMNCSLLETGGGILCVSQFTLYGDARRGRRPSYAAAATPALARPLYEEFLAQVRALAAPRRIMVESGQFQAMMKVELVNDGPVTILLDTEKVF